MGFIIMIAFVWIIATAIQCAVALSNDGKRGRERAAREALNPPKKFVNPFDAS